MENQSHSTQNNENIKYASKTSARQDNWTFFSNHGHVIILIAQNPYLTVREMSDYVGITERAVLAILSDLEAYGCLKVTKEGRRNTYSIIGSIHFRHPIEKDHTIGEMLEVFKA